MQAELPVRWPSLSKMTTMDMFDAEADEDQMDQELVSVLGSIAHAASRDRTTPLPLATRSFAGSYTSRAKRMRT